MRYTVTITGQLDTVASADEIRQDAPAVLTSAFWGVVPGTVEVVSVEPVPEPSNILAEIEKFGSLAELIDAVRSGRFPV